MLIRNQFAIEFDMPRESAMIGLLRLHPSLDERRQGEERLLAEHVEGGVGQKLAVDEYLDGFGNRCKPLSNAGRSSSVDGKQCGGGGRCAGRDCDRSSPARG